MQQHWTHCIDILQSWGACSFKPSAGIAGKCTQNRLQISPIYVSSPNSLLLLHTKCTLQRRTQRPQRVGNIVELGQGIYFTRNL